MGSLPFRFRGGLSGLFVFAFPDFRERRGYFLNAPEASTKKIVRARETHYASYKNDTERVSFLLRHIGAGTREIFYCHAGEEGIRFPAV